ncbi:hypothetical protein CYY_006040 [Polysphondylium violaceum]|uniref:FAD/NAD(P)-binding domain-containing protein n=1 Tax=Polysphondylium violaceum TaxID=133409 RepID=A0A8J4PRY3_9MYCE|nr:hypothetical protein CYY_006040 [Polysphondylium violaceum]
MIHTKKVLIQFQRGYCTVSATPVHLRDKKILINGSDIAGLSLGLFLKKKGISCDIVDTNSTITTTTTQMVQNSIRKTTSEVKPNVGGVVVYNHVYDLLKKLGVYDQLLEKSLQLEGSCFTERDGAAYGIFNFIKLKQEKNPLSISEADMKDILLSECLKFKPSEGIVSIKKSTKIKSIQQSPNSNNNNNNNNKVMITFSNSPVKVSYDALIGSANSIENVDTVRQYLFDKLDKEPSFYKDTHYFSTIVKKCNQPDIPMINTQFAYEKKLVTFPISSTQVAISGSFFKPRLPPHNHKHLIFHEFYDMEDVNSHNIISFQDSATENIALGKVDEQMLKSYSLDNICLIGDAADKLPYDNLLITSIAIEDANQLADSIGQSTSSNLSESISKFDRQRQTRMTNKYLPIIKAEQSIIFRPDWLVYLFGKYYFKYFCSGKKQLKRLKSLFH